MFALVDKEPVLTACQLVDTGIGQTTNINAGQFRILLLLLLSLQLAHTKVEQHTQKHRHTRSN